MIEKTVMEKENSIIPPTEADFQGRQLDLFRFFYAVAKMNETSFLILSIFGIASRVIQYLGNRWTRYARPKVF